ncbi:translocation and assembly module lipoprotein TamL [Ohtaekwangia koreensis]|uniref:Outer membrane protein assembly factor BamA n=1 Tax=Ohtaekwangia koreensis TaxID=688867 RepID=A0A1T5K6Y2_9BACT|nr:BamA/TamA family outer membrane protein [Ohtaekwangia koreensis]SKC59208.1 Outer membrane protein assembly factor BamA [Ohtaekwangia koreensis]
MRTLKRKYFLFATLLPFLLSGCLGIKHLKENEKLLYRQRIEVPRHIDATALYNLHAQRPNRKFIIRPLAPLVSIYYLGYRYYDQEKMIKKKERFEKKFDAKIAATKREKRINNLQFRKQQKSEKLTNKIENGNTVMQWGEPISVFDSSLVRITLERFHSYLFAKGYFLNKVHARIDTLKIYPKRVKVTYTVDPGQAYFLDSIFYQILDTAVNRVVIKNESASFLKKGERYDEDNLTKERERLDLLLKDYGYYDFSRQYIEYASDTSYKTPDRKVAIMIIINDPAKRGYHKKFTVDEVHFTTDIGVNKPGKERSGRTYRDIQYNYYDDNYNLKILSQRVFIKKGELYNRSRTLNTQRQLAYVDAFKFVNINYDTTNGKFISNIFTSPLPRYEWSNEAGVNVTQGYPGPFYNMTFKKRNVFNGMETFDISGRFGFEGVASATEDQNFYKSTEAGINASLTFPQFIWPFKDRVRFRHAEYNPKTKFTVGYAYTDRPEYRRTAISVNGTYSWQNNKNRLYQLTPVNLSVIDTANLSGDFKKLLAEQARLGNFSLLNSFRPSFVNSIIFGVTWNYKNYGNVERNSSFIRAQIESGGTIWNFLDTSIVTRQGLEYFKYLRFSLDIRRINVLTRNTTVAYRFNSGVAYSYSDNESLPYEKFFFAGGSNSIRAWRPRRLGPGSFKPRTTEDPESSGDPVKDGLFDYNIEQPAEILLEASIEVRQKLFGFVSGAVFLDAGNTWTFQQRKKTVNNIEVDNGNSQFRINQFYKEIALGTGFGLRFDFTFLILRFDVGMKVYDPARDENDRFVLDKVRFFKPYATKVTTDSGTTYTKYREPVIYNVGIGFPF